MSEKDSVYFDKKGKKIEIDDQIHYVSKDEINIAWVKEILPNNQGVKILGMNNKRDCVLKNTQKKVIISIKKYYKNRKKTKLRNRV